MKAANATVTVTLMPASASSSLMVSSDTRDQQPIGRGDPHSMRSSVTREDSRSDRPRQPAHVLQRMTANVRRCHSSESMRREEVPGRCSLRPHRSRFATLTNETRIILGSTIGTVLTTATGLAVLITTLFVNLGSRIEALREDMREDYQRLDDRMLTVEQGFAKIDQRLATLERAVIPAAEPAE